MDQQKLNELSMVDEINKLVLFYIWTSLIFFVLSTVQDSMSFAFDVFIPLNKFTSMNGKNIIIDLAKNTFFDFHTNEKKFIAKARHV